MENGSESTALGDGDKAPTTVGGMTHALNGLVVNDAPFSLIIRRHLIITMRASSDFDEDIAIFRSGEQMVDEPLWTDKEQDGRSFTE